MSKTKEIEILEDFKFAHRGCDVVEYKAGDVVPADDELFKIATENKWAKTNEAKKPTPKNKSE